MKNVHKLGMKYMVWFGVPFIGYSSEAYGRFKGKYLNDMKNLDCASLDPRFPEVREYLIETCERILREWISTDSSSILSTCSAGAAKILQLRKITPAAT